MKTFLTFLTVATLMAQPGAAQSLQNGFSAMAGSISQTAGAMALQAIQADAERKALLEQASVQEQLQEQQFKQQQQLLDRQQEIERQAEQAHLLQTYPNWRQIVGVDDQGRSDPANPFRKWLISKDLRYQTAINATQSPAEVEAAIANFMAESASSRQAGR